jgi:UPF0755 protein
LKKLFGLVVVTGIVLAALTYLYLMQALHAAGPLAVDTPVYIKHGSSTKTVAATLESSGVIDNAAVFEIMAQLRRDKGGLKAGEYLFTRGLSISDAISLMQSGRTHQRQFTVPEGLTVVEISAIIDAAEGLTGDLGTLPPEGSLLPETYNYSYGDTKQAVIARMRRNMDTTLAALWEKRTADTILTSAQDVVTLAAVVEKETGIPSERPRVAGVFLNRLKTGMPLQSDPTVIYAITQGQTKMERALTRRDLETESPYNTYLNKGLPPGPIANPGRESLAAVLNPEKHDYYYFVADGTGGHAFGQTLDDHNRNVGKWRQIQRSQKKETKTP